jgi:hypothetical protein
MQRSFEIDTLGSRKSKSAINHDIMAEAKSVAAIAASDDLVLVMLKADMFGAEAS